MRQRGDRPEHVGRSDGAEQKSSLGDRHDHGSTGQNLTWEPPPRDSLESRRGPVPTQHTVGLGGWGPGEGGCPPASDLPLNSGDGAALAPTWGAGDPRPKATEDLPFVHIPQVC